MFADRVRHVVLAGAGVVAIFLTAGCADTRGGTLPYDKPLAAPDEQHFQTLPEDYKIAPMDTLAVKLYQGNLMPGQDQISGDYSVDLAGHISLPLVGEVEAANLTTAELDTKLSQLYGAKYFEHPDVSVAIKKSTAHVVTVDGAVQKGGQFAIAGPITLIQAISLAEGTRDDANPRRLAIFRTVGGQRQAAAFDLTAIPRGEAPDPQVYPGDIIVVDGSKVKAAEKQIFSALPLVGIFRPF